VKRLLAVSIMTIFMIFLAGCGGSSGATTSGGNSYKLPNSNVATLGPLKGAKVEIFKLNDLNKSILTTITGSYGSFDANLSGIDDNDSDMVLVSVTGGEDIDANDDGVIDSDPVKNEGTIHGFATVKDLKNGKVHITLLSELVYQYTKQYLSELKNKSIKEEDFKKMVSLVAQMFIKSDDTNSSLEKLVAFNPIRDKNNSKIDYNKLISGSGCLASLYHEGNNTAIMSKIKRSFTTLPIAIGGSKLNSLKNNYKISFVSSNAKFNTSGVTFDKNGDGFVKKDSNISIDITDIDSGYSILKWSGCDEVSTDLKTCKVFNINTDKLITVMVVPAIKVKPGTIIDDVSNAYVEVDTNSSLSDDNVSLTLYSDLSDKNTTNILKNIAIGDIIVHKTIPVFFGKVANKTKINDFRYDINLTKVPLEKLLESGYMSVSGDKVGTFGSAKVGTSKVISKSLILPNGQKVDFDPNRPAQITLNFKKNRVLLRAAYPNITVKKESDKTVATLYINKYTNVTGTVTLTPIFNYDIAWGLWSGLDFFHLSVGENIDSNVSINTEKSFDFNYKKDITTLTFSQTVMVGPFPIVLDEPITLYIGLDGKVTASGTLGVNYSISPILNIAYAKGIAHTGTTFKPTTTFYGEISGSEDTFAYIGIYPRFEIYGIGGGLDNKVGPYSTINGEAKEKVVQKIKGTTMQASAGLKGVYGIKYIGTLQLSTSWGILKDAIEKVNGVIAKEIVKPYKIGSFDFSSKISSDDKKPGVISIVGPKENYESVKLDDLSSLSKTYNYTLTNTGETDVYYKAEVINKKGNFDSSIYYGESRSTSIKKLCGVIKPGEKKDINLQLFGGDIARIGTYKLKFNIYQSNSSICLGPVVDTLTSFISSILIPSFTSETTVNVTPDDLSTIPEDKLDVKTVGSTVKQLTFTWEKRDVDGYKIYMGDYNSTSKICNSIRLFASTKNVGYSEDLSALESTSKTLRKIEPNKAYCFTLGAYKDYTTFDGDKKEYEDIISPFTTITPVKIVDKNTTDSNATSSELDIMFLVDMTGSYGDDLATFKEKEQNITDSIEKLLPKSMMLKIGVASFQDYPNTTYDDSSTDRPYTLELGLTKDIKQFGNAINNLKLGYGGDTPEAQLEGLYQTITDKNVGWNNSAIKLILLFTDASFHDSDRDPSYPGHGSSEVKKLLSSKGISVIGIASGSTTADLNNISAYTTTLNSSSSGVVNAISSIIEAIPGSKVTSRSFMLRKVAPDPDYVEPNN